MMKKQDEKVLLQLVKEGDVYAFRRMYDAYSKKLFYFSKSLNLDSENAEEIVQETFANIWANRQNIKPEQSLNAYLMTIARNLIYNSVRKQILMKRYLENMAREGPGYDQLPDKDLSYIIYEILQLLPGKCQQVFKMSRLEGYSNQEIADKLSISKSTVENHLNKALHLFRKHLKRYDIGFSLLFLFNS